VSACWLFVRDRRPADRNDADEGIKAGEAGGIGRIQRQALGSGGGGDHQVGGRAPWFTACGDGGCGHAAVDAGYLGIKRHRVELALGPLQDLKPPRALGVFVVGIVLVVATHLVGFADSSAKVMALIAISSGSSAGLIHFRRTRMFVSSMPCRNCSSLIAATSLVAQRCVLVRPERLQVDGRRITRHGGELLPGDEPPAMAQRGQLPDPVTVPDPDQAAGSCYGSCGLATFREPPPDARA